MTAALCRYCGDADAPHLDHIYPQSRGGTRDPGNLTPACARCNGSKGGRTPEEWLCSGAPQARIAAYHARRGGREQSALRLDISDWWIDCRVHLGEELWRRFGQAISGRNQGRHGATNRPAVLRDFAAWYLRRPGAKLPVRPPREESMSHAPPEPHPPIG